MGNRRIQKLVCDHQVIRVSTNLLSQTSATSRTHYTHFYISFEHKIDGKNLRPASCMLFVIYQGARAALLGLKINRLVFATTSPIVALQ